MIVSLVARLEVDTSNLEECVFIHDRKYYIYDFGQFYTINKKVEKQDLITDKELLKELIESFKKSIVETLENELYELRKNELTDLFQVDISE